MLAPHTPESCRERERYNSKERRKETKENEEMVNLM